MRSHLCKVDIAPPMELVTSPYLRAVLELCAILFLLISFFCHKNMHLQKSVQLLGCISLVSVFLFYTSAAAVGPCRTASEFYRKLRPLKSDLNLLLCRRPGCLSLPISQSKFYKLYVGNFYKPNYPSPLAQARRAAFTPFGHIRQAAAAFVRPVVFVPPIFTIISDKSPFVNALLKIFFNK